MLTRKMAGTLHSSIKTLLLFSASVICSLGISMLGIGKESVIMVFLLGVLFTSVLTGNFLWGIINSFFSVAVFNYLYTDPRFTFVIYSTGDVILLLFFLITAIVSGTVTSKLQQQIEITLKNEQTSMILYKIASGFLSISGREKVVSKAVFFIKEFTGLDCYIKLLPDKTSIHTERAAGEKFIIRNAAGEIGCIRIKGLVKDGQKKLIIQAIATQLGIALDREYLNRERENIRVAMERENLRAALLRSVAHDLRSPLTALSGAGSLLADNFDTLTYEEKKKLANDMSEEILWLINLVENILNMTRINDSKLLLHKEDEVIDDVVSEAVSHTARLLKNRNFKVILPDEILMIPMDGKLIVQVLINLIENAARHTSTDSEIVLKVFEKNSFLYVEVSDTGEGLSKSVRDHLFEKFVTVEKAVIDGKKGIGLGLSICKAIVEAHGGSIMAEPNLPTGTKFVFTLPMGGENGKG